jgi:hypothetical protein
MYTTAQAISAGARFYLNPGSDDWRFDAELRQRLHFYLTQVCQRAIQYAPFWWKRTNGTVTLTAGVGSLPPDFNSLGEHGEVYVQGSSEGALVYMPSEELEALLKLSPSTGTPRRYTWSGVSGLGLRQIKTWPTDNSTLEIKQYDRCCPELIDAPIAPAVAIDDTAGNVTGPVSYVMTYVTAAGETEGGPVSVSIEPATQQVTLSAIPVSAARSVTGRKFYRTAAGGYQHKLVSSLTLTDNLPDEEQTRTLTDNTADGSLGANAPVPGTATYTGLEIFPADFHESLLLPGLREAIASSVSDNREGMFSAQWIRDLRRMWGDQKPGQNQGWALPVFAGAQGIGSTGSRSWRHRIPTS